MIADPNDACCETAYCTPKSIPTAAPHLQPSLQPGQNPNLTPLPGHTFAPHTLKPGETLAPGLTPIPGQTFAPNPNNTSPSGQTPVIRKYINRIRFAAVPRDQHHLMFVQDILKNVHVTNFPG